MSTPLPACPRRVCAKCRRAVPPGECPHCRPLQRADSDRRRGSPAARGYDADWQRTARTYLAEHRICVQCGRPSAVADHYPRTRRELVAAGVPDPDAWHRLRALCKLCHDRHTAATTPGGWAVHRDLNG